MKKPEPKRGVTALLLKYLEKIRAHLANPALFIGNPKRVRKQGEEGGDEEKLNDLNKSWREMLHGDPWMKKLMTHVRLLILTMGIFFLTLLFSGMYMPTGNAISEYICAAAIATIPYWLWVGGWYGRIDLMKL